MSDLFSNELPADFLNSLPAVIVGNENLLSDLTRMESASSEESQLARLLKVVNSLEKAQSTSGGDKWFDPDGPYPISATPKHAAFFAAGAEYPERLFLAGNRVGKTLAGAFECTCHLTGEYPTWWVGRVFTHPVDGWAVGPDARTVRDTIQKELLGGLGAWGTGMIPAHKLGKASSLQGVPGAIDTIQIKHVSGGWSTLGFKNYKQDIQAFMGTSRHFIWTDEECPIEVWNECNIRTATTKGIMLATFTPLEGLTRMVINFCRKADFLAGARPMVALQADEEEGDELVGSSNKKAVIQAGWDDAPWLDGETKQRLLADTPEHLRDARSKGIPSMGSGNVFATPIEQVVCTPFEIPANWPRMYGLDVGWNRTAVIWAALDPNSDTLYFYDEHYQGEMEPYQHAYSIRSRGEWVPGVIDPATRGRGQADGQKIMTLYKKEGLKLWPAKNERESGIQALAQRYATGKCRVFRTCTNFQKEYMLYRRDTRGRVVDEDDHLMDACFDDQTEVMTKDGFKFWKDVKANDTLATINLATDTLEYQEPEELIVKDWDGEMHFFDNKAQQFVTPNHNMVVYRRHDGYASPQLVAAEHVTTWDKIKCGAKNWEGVEYVPPIDGVDPLVFAEFMGWWIAEGSLLHAYPCNPYRFGVVVSQVKPQGVDDLRILFDKMPGSWAYSGSSYTCTNKKLYDYLKQFGLARDKKVPQEIKDATQEIIAAFLKGYIAGDGWSQGRGTVASASVSKKLTDDIQELFFKLGKSGNILKRAAAPYKIHGRAGTNTRDQWWFVENKIQTAMLRDSKNTPNFSKLAYAGKVYCATVPNGTLVVRRNGKISVSGNSRYVINNLIRMTSSAQARPNMSGTYRSTQYDI